MENTGGGGRSYDFCRRWGIPQETALLYYWKRGDTASEIALQLARHHGFVATRNAVIAKANRLGVKPRPRAGGKPPKRKADPNRPARLMGYKPKQPVPVSVLDEVFRAPDCIPKSIWEVGYGECRYIVDSTVLGGLYCAAPTEVDVSWCAYHERIVYRPR